MLYIFFFKVWSPLVRRHLLWPPSMVYISINITHIYFTDYNFYYGPLRAASMCCINSSVLFDMLWALLLAVPLVLSCAALLLICLMSGSPSDAPFLLETCYISFYVHSVLVGIFSPSCSCPDLSCLNCILLVILWIFTVLYLSLFTTLISTIQKCKWKNFPSAIPSIIQ